MSEKSLLRYGWIPRHFDERQSKVYTHSPSDTLIVGPAPLCVLYCYSTVPLITVISVFLLKIYESQSIKATHAKGKGYTRCWDYRHQRTATIHPEPELELPWEMFHKWREAGCSAAFRRKAPPLCFFGNAAECSLRRWQIWRSRHKDCVCVGVSWFTCCHRHTH